MIRRLLMALALGVLPIQAPAQAEIWDLEVTPSPRLGLAFPGADTQFYPLIAQMGIGVVRVSAAWARVEPRQGAFDFRGLDSRVSALQALDIAPFMTFESNAAWGAFYTDTVKNGTPRDMALWTRFVRAVVDRYDGDGTNDMPGLRAPVRLYQGANEFLSPTNRSGGWAGTHDALIAYVNATHDAVKAEDPDAQFILGGVAAFNADIGLLALRGATFEVQQTWSETSRTIFAPDQINSPDIQEAINDRFLPVIRQTRYDMASVHLYGPETRDAARLAMFADLTQRPVISSECGGPSLDYDGTYSGHGHYAAVLHRNLNVWAAGSAYCLWFGLGEAITATYGNARVQLYDVDEQPKPGTQAYRLLARIAPHLQKVTAKGTHGFEISTDHGTIWIAIGAQGRQALTDVPTDAPVICLKDAQSRDAFRTIWGQLGAKCGAPSIILAGSALLLVLQVN